MDLLPTPEQEEIVTSIASVIAGNHTTGEPLTDALWEAAAAQGWFGLGLEEALGGVGYSLAEEVLLFTELGRAAVPGPFLATVLASRLAAEAGEADLTQQLISGSDRVGLAERWDDDRFSVLDADGATMALIVDGERVTLVDLGGVALDSIPSFDTLVPVSLAIDLHESPALATAPDGPALLRRGALLSAALLAGIAKATTDQSVCYGIDREQFGQPVGGFQAVKHRCADMAARAEAATSLSRYAALAVVDGRTDGAFHAQAAWTVASEAAVTNAQVNIQNHGGIGFTWEHTAHRFLTRAQFLVRTLGDRRHHLSALLAEPAPT